MLLSESYTTNLQYIKQTEILRSSHLISFADRALSFYYLSSVIVILVYLPTWRIKISDSADKDLKGAKSKYNQTGKTGLFPP